MNRVVTHVHRKPQLRFSTNVELCIQVHRQNVAVVVARAPRKEACTVFSYLPFDFLTEQPSFCMCLSVLCVYARLSLKNPKQTRSHIHTHIHFFSLHFSPSLSLFLLLTGVSTTSATARTAPCRSHGRMACRASVRY